MNYEQKALALSALGWSDFEIKIRAAGDWYATCAGEIRDDCVLKTLMGNGATPEAAIEDLWKQATILKSGEYIVTGAFGDKRAAFRWNGFMWQPVIEKVAAA